MSNLILGPTFEEMLHPNTIAPDIRRRALEMKTKDPLRRRGHAHRTDAGGGAESGGVMGGSGDGVIRRVAQSDL